jgi:hypothetical protein
VEDLLLVLIAECRIGSVYWGWVGGGGMWRTSILAESVTCAFAECRVGVRVRGFVGKALHAPHLLWVLVGHTVCVCVCVGG